LKKGDKGWVARAASKTKKVLKGKGKSYTAMKPKGSRWLHTEAAICDGIAFKTFFVGSIQVPFAKQDGSKNQAVAIEASKKLVSNAKPDEAQSAFLNVSSGKMTLISRPDESIIMRHSTCRVAFSTVDPANPTTFCYVALVKDTELALCHVFRAKTAKQAYELTFTCAQAFDFNYRAFVAKSSAALDSSVLEPTLEPEAIRDHIATIVETMDSVAAADEEAEDMRANAGYMEISSMIFNAAAAGLEEYIKEEEEDHGVPITSSPAPAGGGSRLNGAAGYLEVEDGSPSMYIDVLPTPKDTYMDDGLLTTPMKAAGYMTVMPNSPSTYLDISNSLNF